MRMAETNTEKSRDEEFYYLLTEGSEHLQGGRIDEARVHFERALQIHSTNEQALNLLGLSLFRLGQLDRARQIFFDLVHGNPVEPSLRLNLAMVFLKQGRLEDAHKELEHVLDLNPDHPRASSYMGLVLEKKGQLERAADYYERAGNKKRADEIRAFTPTKTGTFPIANLAAMGVQQVPAPAAPGPAAMRAASAPPTAVTTPPSPHASPPAPPPAPPAATTTSSMPVVKPATMTMSAVQVTPNGQVVAAARAPSPPPSPPPPTTPPSLASMPPSPASAAARAIEQAESARAAALNEPDPRRAAVARALPSTTPPASTTAASTASPTAPASTAPTPTPSAAPASSTAPPAAVVTAAPDTGVTEVSLTDLPGRALDGHALSRSDEGHLTFPIVDNGYVRSDLLTGLSGALEVEVVHRRYRGKKTDSLFGGVDAAVVALAGKGFALLSLGELLATSLRVASEELYLVESAVVGFSKGLVWENGRLPSEADRDLDIVHLRGTGNVVLGTKRPVVAFTVGKDAPCVVHAARLVGWSGQLLPFRAPLPGLPEAARRVPVVRFEGTGIVLAV
jgi:Flp pilus assembly protein TadD